MARFRRPTPFWDRVDKSDGCWIWMGDTYTAGYGRAWHQGRQRGAHRVAYELVTGTPIPDGKHVLHRCDNPPCVRPDHLELGTHRDNMRDMTEKGRHAKPDSMLRGEAHPQARLTTDDVREIRRLLPMVKARRLTRQEIADKFGITRDHVRDIHRWRCWKEVA